MKSYNHQLHCNLERNKKYFRLCKKRVNFEFVLENVHDATSQTRAVKKRKTIFMKCFPYEKDS